MDDLRRYVGEPPEGVAVITSVIARWWWRRPRRAWTSIPAHLRQLGLSVIVLGISPTATPLTVSHGFVFRHPDFHFERISLLRPTGIGSGNGIPQVIAALEELVRPENLNEGLLRFEVGLPMGGAGALGLALGAALEEKPTADVSAEFQIWRLRRGEILVGTNETTALTPGATSRVLPRLATSWPEFEELTAEAGRAATAAVA